MSSCRTLIALAAGTLMWVSAAGAGELLEMQGRWERTTFIQTNVLCQQTWQCAPAEDTVLGDDWEIERTKTQLTTGACIAQGNPASCTICGAPEPEVACVLTVTIPD